MTQSPSVPTPPSVQTQKRIKLRTTKPKDPHCPKRPQCSYFIFMNERRSTLRSQNPGKSMTELTKMIAAEWNQMATPQKQTYDQRAVQLKQEYNIKLNQYHQTENYKKYQRQIEKWKKEQQEKEQQGSKKPIPIILDDSSSGSSSDDNTNSDNTNNPKTIIIDIADDRIIQIIDSNHNTNNPEAIILDEKDEDSTLNSEVQSAEFASNEQLNDKISGIDENINDLIKKYQEQISGTTTLTNLREMLSKIQNRFKKEWIEAQQQKLKIFGYMKSNNKTHFESSRSVMESVQREYMEIQADDKDLDHKIKLQEMMLNELRSKKEVNRILMSDKAEILNERRMCLNQRQKECNETNERMEEIKRKKFMMNIFDESVKNELKRNESNYHEWSTNDVITWIKFIEKGKFNDVAYVDVIRQIEKIEIRGDKLSDLRNETVLKLIGINGMDQKAFIMNVNRVINGNQLSGESQNTAECGECAINPINSVFLPCGHQFCCFGCYEKSKPKYQNCPICRKVVINTVKTFMNGF